MKGWVVWQESYRNLASAKLRSFLAVLGILVGSASVVALILSGQLATEHALSQFKKLGTNLLAMTIYANQPNSESASGLPFKQIDRVKNSSPAIDAIAPYQNIFSTIQINGKSKNIELIATTHSLRQIAKIGLARGRFISDFDRDHAYCVMGAKLADQFYHQGIDPLGKTIKVGPRYFIVIGIAKPWRPNYFLYNDLNNSLIIPLRASALIQSDQTIRDFLFVLQKNADLEQVQQQMKQKIQLYFPTQRVHFRDPKQIIDVLSNQRQTFTWLLGAIGGISLVVGGIGVMNVMLVSVVERRREIGIRKAIGARQRDILWMFLIEAICLTLAGGVLGILAGVSVAWLLAYTSGWDFFIYPLPVLLGFTVSLLVGLLSGWYPAWRASSLDPIICLRD